MTTTRTPTNEWVNNGEPPWLDAKRKQLPPKWSMKFYCMDNPELARVVFSDGAGHDARQGLAIHKDDVGAYNVPWCVNYLKRHDGFVVEGEEVEHAVEKRPKKVETDIVGETNGLGMPRMPERGVDVTSGRIEMKTVPLHDFREGERVMVHIGHGVEVEAIIGQIAEAGLIGVWLNGRPADFFHTRVRRPELRRLVADGDALPYQKRRLKELTEGLE